MAETIFQKRIYELGTFIVYTQGEPEWEDPSTIWLAVDRLGWPEAKKMSLVEFVSNLHKEQGPVPLSGVNVVELFDIPFSSPNYYIEIKCLRQVNLPGGATTFESIPMTNFIKTQNGFELKLYDYQPGDVLNYLAFE